MKKDATKPADSGAELGVDVEELIAKGKKGDLSSSDIDAALETMDFDIDSLDKLYDTLESNGIPLPGDLSSAEMSEIEHEIEHFGAGENFTLQSLPNHLTGGKKFRITFQVYDVLGNLASYADERGDGAFVLLHMQGGKQNSAAGLYKVQVSDTDRRLLTLTFDDATPGGTDDLLFYQLTTMEFLIGSVTIQQLN